MWYVEFLYLLLIVLIIVLIFLIFTYSSYQSKNIYTSDDPNGLSIAATTTLSSIDNSGDLALVPVTSSRSQKISGKFIMQLSSSSTEDIYMQVLDQGKVIGDKTKYTIWDKSSYGITQTSLIFNSNELSEGTAHVITPQIATVAGAAGVSLHAMYVYYY